MTIIIPSYNQQEYLPDAIESALSQTVRPEIIVVDDGSTDNSLAIARGYEKDGVKVIAQVNKGLAAARNTGILNATEEYILPLDSDDMLLDTAVERLTEIAEATDADIVAPSFKAFGANDYKVILTVTPTLEDFATANRFGYFSTMRRSKLLEVGGYSPRMIWGYEDYHLWFDLLSRGAKAVVLPDILVLYRVKERSMIHDAQAHHNELMAQIQKDFPNVFKEASYESSG